MQANCPHFRQLGQIILILGNNFFVNIDFLTTINEVLEEQGKTPSSLFENKIVSENTFYKYKQRFPSLKTLLKIANFLKISIDYLFEFCDVNHFKPYDFEKIRFYDNLTKLLRENKLSARKFCNDLHFSHDNILRWKNGTLPSIQTLNEIAKYFDCSFDDLIF